MRPVIKTQHKTEAEEAQRHYFWSLTPCERLVLAAQLNRQARAIGDESSANQPPAQFANGERVLKSATPIPRRKG